LAVLASLAASLYPALHLSGIDPNRALKAGGSAGTQRGQHRLRSGFVVAQVALTLVLLVVSGMLIRVVTHYLHTDLGFDPAHILAVHIDLSRDRYHGRDMQSAFYRPLEERTLALPGVRAAGLIDLLPILNFGSNSDVHIAGQPPYPPNQVMLAENRIVSAGYFNAMGIPLHAGRNLSPNLDHLGITGGAVVVNDAFVGKFIPAGLDPTAQRIDDDPKEENWTRIVGVTGSARQSVFQSPRAERDLLMDQIPADFRGDVFSSMYLVVRTSGDPHAIIAPLRSVVHDLDPTVPFGEPESMAEVVAETLAFQRMEGWLFGIFGALALALALVGLYGLISHEVEQGTRDIGVRMALGATRSRILAMVLSRVSVMLAGGAAAGLALTFIARKVIGMVIYIDAQKQAGSFILTALVLIAAGLIAALIPAARAASIEPVRALRTE